METSLLERWDPTESYQLQDGTGQSCWRRGGCKNCSGFVLYLVANEVDYKDFVCTTRLFQDRGREGRASQTLLSEVVAHGEW